MQLRLWKSYSPHFSLLSLLYFIAACSSTPDKQTDQQSLSGQPASIKVPTQSSSKQQSNMQPDDLLYAILRSEYTYWAGSPYRLGGNTLRGIDCSSLVQQVFKNSFNIPLPRTTEYQVKKGFAIKKSELKVGDLVFFKTSRTTRHVGIYMGNNEFFHVSTSKGTKISSLSNPYWRKHYWQSRRII
ncbi:NlpC/P60 family protein [Psychromonas sp. GE-S-Ul-11]|uniref:NlpC/P60 family protein n=1 Tax=Psychromonas sp. GE-S-Ul-11 TaxID=3241170 RepID=UPI00390CCAA4